MQQTRLRSSESTRSYADLLLVSSSLLKVVTTKYLDECLQNTQYDSRVLTQHERVNLHGVVVSCLILDSDVVVAEICQTDRPASPAIQVLYVS